MLLGTISVRFYGSGDASFGQEIFDILAVQIEPVVEPVCVGNEMKRLALTSNGNIRYHLKTPCRDGTTDVIFERGGPPSLDFIAKLAALAWPAAYEATHKSDAFSRGVRSGRPPAQ